MQKDLEIQQALEHRILHGLACEWKAALWVLPPNFQVHMRMPLFCLKDMKTRVGYWSGDKKEICLSHDLVFNHPWGKIREVLRHEMAHQLAEQVLGLKRNEPPHGETFQNACHLLRADPRASEILYVKDSSRKHPSPGPEVKIVRQVKKLMALAGSRNKHEAESAMAKAHELIAKYNIDLLSHEENREYVSVLIGAPALRHFRDAYHLAGLLLDYYFVEGIWVSAYVLEKGKMGRVLEISGTAHNVEIAGYVYDFVTQYCRRQWQAYNKGKGLNHYRKIDFNVGIIEGFRGKLESQYQNGETKKETLALVKAKDPQLKAYTAYRYPNTVSFRRGASSQDDGVIRDGMRIGKKMIISKAITNKDGFNNRFLE